MLKITRQKPKEFTTSPSRRREFFARSISRRIRQEGRRRREWRRRGEKDGEGGCGGVGGGDGEGKRDEKREHVESNLISLEFMVVDSLGGDGWRQVVGLAGAGGSAQLDVAPCPSGVVMARMKLQEPGNRQQNMWHIETLATNDNLHSSHFSSCGSYSPYFLYHLIGQVITRAAIRIQQTIFFLSIMVPLVTAGKSKCLHTLLLTFVLPTCCLYSIDILLQGFASDCHMFRGIALLVKSAISLCGEGIYHNWRHHIISWQHYLGPTAQHQVMPGDASSPGSENQEFCRASSPKHDSVLLSGLYIHVCSCTLYVTWSSTNMVDAHLVMTDTMQDQI